MAPRDFRSAASRSITTWAHRRFRTSPCCRRSRWQKIRNDAPFDKICYIGCGVTTGIGAVINTAKVEQGATAVVFGLGVIGLNVTQGLRHAGADMIIGVDVNNDKKAWGEKFGMKDFVHQKDI